MTKQQKKELFDKAGLTQIDLARLAGVSQPSVSHWLRTEPEECRMYHCLVIKIEKYLTKNYK